MTGATVQPHPRSSRESTVPVLGRLLGSAGGRTTPDALLQGYQSIRHAENRRCCATASSKRVATPPGARPGVPTHGGRAKCAVTKPRMVRELFTAASRGCARRVTWGPRPGGRECEPWGGPRRWDPIWFPKVTRLADRFLGMARSERAECSASPRLLSVCACFSTSGAVKERAQAVRVTFDKEVVDGDHSAC